MNETISSNRQSAPIVKAYCIFAILASSFSIFATIYNPLGRATVPYTGWLGGFMYAFTIFFAVTVCLNADLKILRAIISFQKLFLVFGILDCGQAIYEWLNGAPNYGNPYLTYSPWRPLFTIGVPAMWWYLLNCQYKAMRSTGPATNKPMDRSGGPAAS